MMKLLIISGKNIDSDETSSAEVVDLENPEAICTNLMDVPQKLQGATGTSSVTVQKKN